LKDQRYYAIKSLIETDKLHSLIDVFKIIPLTIVRSDMHANYTTLRKRIISSANITVNDIKQMSELFDVDPGEILKLALNDYKLNSNHK